MDTVVTLIVLFPLSGFVTLLFFGRRLGEPRSGYLAGATVGIPFVLAAVASLDFLSGDAESGTTVVRLFEWIPSLGVDASLAWDPLSAVMTLVVTGVGALIHVYSIGYMAGEARFGQFFAYLNLFITSMLILVLGSNFAVLFVGWELVGLSSYLLISFWYERPSAAAAGKKAFIVNRIGDLGFLIALMLIFTQFGSLDFAHVFENAEQTLGGGSGMATAITLLLLVGAAGKSAAASPLCVAARCDGGPDAGVGADPRRHDGHRRRVHGGAHRCSLRPCSDLGGRRRHRRGAHGPSTRRRLRSASATSSGCWPTPLSASSATWFLAVGVGAYVAGIFHLVTHAFFKALLFLGAGSVIHALGGEQDLRKMGGLRAVMPRTFATMAIAWLALSGLPPLAGFWSKDEILAATFERGGWFVLLWGVGIATAVLTGFYVSRMMFLTFWRQPRWSDGVEPHESPALMTVPLVALGGLAVVGGLINTPFRPALEDFLEPSFAAISTAHLPGAAVQWLLAAVSIAAAAAGVLYAYGRYLGDQPLPYERGTLWERLEHGYYVDDLHGKTLVLPGKALAENAAFTIDARIVDGAVNGTGWVVRQFGNRLRRLQTGRVRNYGAGMLAGAVGLLLWMLLNGGPSDGRWLPGTRTAFAVAAGGGAGRRSRAPASRRLDPSTHRCAEHDAAGGGSLRVVGVRAW